VCATANIFPPATKCGVLLVMAGARAGEPATHSESRCICALSDVDMCHHAQAEGSFMTDPESSLGKLAFQERYVMRAVRPCSLSQVTCAAHSLWFEVGRSQKSRCLLKTSYNDISFLRTSANFSTARKSSEMISFFTFVSREHKFSIAEISFSN
jgi:hypothetical protein